MSSSEKRKVNYRKILATYTARFMRRYYSLWETILMLEATDEQRIPLKFKIIREIEYLRSSLPRIEGFLFILMSDKFSEEQRYKLLVKDCFTRIKYHIQNYRMEYESFVIHLTPKPKYSGEPVVIRRVGKDKGIREDKWIRKMKLRYLLRCETRDYVLENFVNGGNIDEIEVQKEKKISPAVPAFNPKEFHSFLSKMSQPLFKPLSPIKSPPKVVPLTQVSNHLCSSMVASKRKLDFVPFLDSIPPEDQIQPKLSKIRKTKSDFNAEEESEISPEVPRFKRKELDSFQFEMPQPLFKLISPIKSPPKVVPPAIKQVFNQLSQSDSMAGPKIELDFSPISGCTSPADQIWQKFLIMQRLHIYLVRSSPEKILINQEAKPRRCLFSREDGFCSVVMKSA